MNFGDGDLFFHQADDELTTTPPESSVYPRTIPTKVRFGLWTRLSLPIFVRYSWQAVWAISRSKSGLLIAIYLPEFCHSVNCYTWLISTQKCRKGKYDSQPTQDHPPQDRCHASRVGHGIRHRPRRVESSRKRPSGFEVALSVCGGHDGPREEN